MWSDDWWNRWVYSVQCKTNSAVEKVQELEGSVEQLTAQVKFLLTTVERQQQLLQDLQDLAGRHAEAGVEESPRHGPRADAVRASGSETIASRIDSPPHPARELPLPPCDWHVDESTLPVDWQLSSVSRDEPFVRTAWVDILLLHSGPW